MFQNSSELVVEEPVEEVDVVEEKEDEDVEDALERKEEEASLGRFLRDIWEKEGREGRRRCLEEREAVRDRAPSPIVRPSSTWTEFLTETEWALARPRASYPGFLGVGVHCRVGP